MSRRIAALAAVAGTAVAVIGGGAAYAAVSAGEPPVPVVSNDAAANSSVFGCYNGGKFSYAEWRLPLPHTCWYAGDVLVQLPAQTLTFKITVPKSVTGGGADLVLTETCTVTGNQQTADAQNPSYTCTVAAS